MKRAKEKKMNWYKQYATLDKTDKNKCEYIEIGGEYASRHSRD